MRRNSLLPAPDPEVRARNIAAALFLATCTSVFLVRWLRWEEGGLLDSATLWNAWAFAATLMAVLLAHELGHFAVARSHGFRLSLPWFLPAPILVGTFGAVIRLRDPPRTRVGLLEMGAAGPLAGAAVVVVVASFRLMAGTEVRGGMELGAPLLWRGLSWIWTGQLEPITTADPVGFACWLGCLLTAMNLIPIGQLDGGHVLAALLPAQSRMIGWFATVLLLAAGLAWPGWAVWAAVIQLLGARTPLEVRRPEQRLNLRSRLVAILAAATFVGTVIPVP